MIILLLLLALTVGILLWQGLRWGLRFAGTRLVLCPANHQVAAVRVDAVAAGVGAALGEPCLRLSECSRWPQHDCAQECLRQIEYAPEDCLLRNMVRDWYAGQRCVFCGRQFDALHWHDHAPALIDADGRTVQWKDVPLPQLPVVFDTHQPVCWNCHIAQSFRREHADLVTLRPPH